MKREMNKKYEAPSVKVTELETKDILMASDGALQSIGTDKLLGTTGKIKYVDID